MAEQRSRLLARARFVNRANDRPDNRKFDQSTNAPGQQDFRCQRLHGESDEIRADSNKREHNSKLNPGTGSAAAETARKNHGEEKCDDCLTEQKQREVATKAFLGPPERRG